MGTSAPGVTKEFSRRTDLPASCSHVPWDRGGPRPQSSERPPYRERPGRPRSHFNRVLRLTHPASPGLSSRRKRSKDQPASSPKLYRSTQPARLTDDADGRCQKSRHDPLAITTKDKAWFGLEPSLHRENRTAWTRGHVCSRRAEKNHPDAPICLHSVRMNTYSAFGAATPYKKRSLWKLTWLAHSAI